MCCLWTLYKNFLLKKGGGLIFRIRVYRLYIALSLWNYSAIMQSVFVSARQHGVHRETENWDAEKQVNRGFLDSEGEFGFLVKLIGSIGISTTTGTNKL